MLKFPKDSFRHLDILLPSSGLEFHPILLLVFVFFRFVINSVFLFLLRLFILSLLSDDIHAFLSIYLLKFIWDIC
jgi:hypothetical protein